MTNFEWKTCMGNFIEAVERELHPKVPTRTKALLDGFRERLRDQRIRASRKSFEQDLEEFLESTSALRAAARRHIRKTAPPLIHAAVAALARARVILAQPPNPQ